MTRQLCARRPAEFWEPKHDGARLALALCAVCPARGGCLDQDPTPHGVIRAGIAWSDDGKPMRICDSCGYPLLGAPNGGSHSCARCGVPTLSRFMSSIVEWKRRGLSDRACGARVGATGRQVKDALRHRAKNRREGDPDEADRGDGPVDEAAVERALAGERAHLTGAELIAAFQAGAARGVPLSRLANQLGVNTFAARKMLGGELTPGRAKRQRIEAALRRGPDVPDYALAKELGVGRPTVARVRRRMAERSQSVAS